MCFTYLQENSSSQTNGLKRRLSQGSIYLYVVLHLLVAARFAFQFWKHVLIRVLYLQRAYVHGPRFDRSFIFFFFSIHS